MENRDLSILTQVAFKAHVEKVTDTRMVNWDLVIEDAVKLSKAIDAVVSKMGTPFNNKPASAPRGTPAVGDPCPVCKSPLKASKNGNGAYCWDCWVAKKK